MLLMLLVYAFALGFLVAAGYSLGLWVFRFLRYPRGRVVIDSALPKDRIHAGDIRIGRISGADFT